MEVLAGFVIIGILAAIAISSYLYAIDRARRTSAISALATIRSEMETYYREHKIDYILNLLKLSLRARRAWQSHSLGLLRRPAKRRTPRNDPVRLMETILCSK